MPPSDAETGWRVRIRRLEPDDEFFHEGNLFCHLASSSKLLSSAEKEDIFRRDEDSWTFACQVASCRETFADHSSYESHYNSRHRNVCISCKKVLPTSYLLDIHISEEHDPVFALCTNNRKYRCLVESCLETFADTSQRKDHLIRAHKYPSSFRFGRESSEARHLQQAATTQPTGSAGTTHDIRLPANVDKATLTGQDGASVSHAVQGRTFTYATRVPSSVSFGRGVLRGFKSGRGRARHASLGLARPAAEAQPKAPAFDDADRGSSDENGSFEPALEVDMSDVAAALPVD